MKTITFHGKKFEYDERAPKRYTVQKKIALRESDPAGMYEAINEIFCGKEDEVAQALDDDAEAFGDLLEAVMLAVGGEAKN